MLSTWSPDSKIMPDSFREIAWGSGVGFFLQFRPKSDGCSHSVTPWVFSAAMSEAPLDHVIDHLVMRTKNSSSQKKKTKQQTNNTPTNKRNQYISREVYGRLWNKLFLTQFLSAQWLGKDSMHLSRANQGPTKLFCSAIGWMIGGQAQSSTCCLRGLVSPIILLDKEWDIMYPLHGE